MQHFIIEDERSADSCATCCCQSAKGKPGETDKWLLNYGPIILPAGAQRLMEGTRFEAQPLNNCFSGNCDPNGLVSPALMVTSVDVDLTQLLTEFVQAQPGATLRFDLAPFSCTCNGRISIAESGLVIYRPHPGFIGYDRFFWQVSVDGAAPIVVEGIIAVGTPLPTVMMLSPDICVNGPQLDNRRFSLSFGVKISPAVAPGSVYRLSVKQGYRDCNGCYDRTDCFDITVGACR